MIRGGSNGEAPVSWKKSGALDALERWIALGFCRRDQFGYRTQPAKGLAI